MIKNLTGSNGVTVAGGNTSMPYISQNPNNPIQGMIRIWGSDMQVFDGTSWINVGTSYATVTLDQDAQDLLHWVRTQRQLEMNRKTLIAHNPALQKAHEAIERAEANFDILAKFVENDTDAGLVESSP